MLQHRISRIAQWALFALAFSPLVAAEVKRPFDIAAGDAAQTLPRFAEQANREIVFSPAAVRGIKTNAVTGEHTPGEALAKLIAATGLTTTQDAKTGAISVQVESLSPNGQRAAQPTTSDRPRQNPNKPIGAGEEKAIELSPFEVTSDQDRGFAAAGSLAGGRLASDLRDTPAAYSVVTRDFIDALGITDLNEATRWSTGNSEPLTAGSENFLSNTGQYSTRGINATAQSNNAGNRQRNFFPLLSYGDSYNIERYDFGRGPNSILFGNGTLVGISSSTTKRAQTDREFQTLRLRVGSWRSFRSELDVNQPLLDKKVAVRASLLWQDSDDWRMNGFDKRKGAFLTTTLKPFKNTEIRLEGEYFKNARNNGSTNINDRFSGWNGTTTYKGLLAALPANANEIGISRRGANYYIYDPFGPANAIMNYQNDPITLAGGATATTPIAGFTQVGTASLNTNGAMLLHARAVPASRFDTAIAHSFFRPITDEFTTATDGPQQIQYSRDLQFTVTQRFGDNLFFEVAGDVNTSDLFVSGPNPTGPLSQIFIDINQALPNGAPNPNFLQPYSDADMQRNRWAHNNRNLRGAAAYLVPANRFGKFAFNVLGGINHRERNQDYRFLTLNDGSDHRQWGIPAQQLVKIRRYWNAPGRPMPGGWGVSGQGDLARSPITFIDPISGVSKQIQPRWTIDNERADTQAIDTSDFNYVLASLNAKFFKERLVLLGAVRYDTYKFAVDIQKNRGDYPLDWDGRNRIMRPAAPADYLTLMYQPKDAAGVPNAPPQTAVTRPRIAATGDRNPLYLKDRFQDDYNPPDLTGTQVTRSVGSVLHVFSWFNPSINYAETFNPPTGTPRINGQLKSPTVAKGTDYGLRMELFKRQLDVNFIYYESQEDNALDNFEAPFFNGLINANAVGDQSSTGTNIQGVAALPLVFRDSMSRNAKGFEVEVAYNPSKALRLTANYSQPKTGTSNRYPDFLGFIAANRDVFKRIATDAGALIDAQNVASVNTSIPINNRSPDVQSAVNNYNAIFDFEKTWKGRGPEINDRQARGNLFADYTFQTGLLKRIRVGAGVRYYGKESIGDRASDSIVNPANRAQAIDDPAVDGTDKVFRPAYSLVTATLAYSWRLKDRRELQANLVVDNLLNDRGPIYFDTILRPKGGDYTSPARETVPNQFQLKRPISYNLSLTLKL
jgi:outer membrane receptor protein involved in Fe transport